MARVIRDVFMSLDVYIARAKPTTTYPTWWSPLPRRTWRIG